MTNNKIIKALEHCIEGICKGCAYYDVDSCIAKCRRNALDLIKRQKAEIEHLKSIIRTMSEDGEE